MKYEDVVAIEKEEEGKKEVIAVEVVVEGMVVVDREGKVVMVVAEEGK